MPASLAFVLRILVVLIKHILSTLGYFLFFIRRKLTVAGDTVVPPSLSSLHDVQLDPGQISRDSLDPTVQAWVVHDGDRNSQGRAFTLLEWSYLKGKLWLWDWGDNWHGYLEGLKRIDHLEKTSQERDRTMAEILDLPTPSCPTAKFQTRTI